MATTPAVKGHKATYVLVEKNRRYGNSWRLVCECGFTMFLPAPGAKDGLRLNHRLHRQEVLKQTAVSA